MRSYLTVLTRPGRTALHLLSRMRPDSWWQRYDQLSRARGLQHLYLVLSFDCDTPEDAEVVLDLDLRLRDVGVTPMYAVPGALLESKDAVYGKLLLRGASFLNHGYEQHTVWNPNLGRYESCFFYDKLPRARVQQDIERGHGALQKVLGVSAGGFRTPHFGTFQSAEQLGFLHATLAELGYRYSTSTEPSYSFKYGAVFDRFGLPEFPVSGAFSRPMTIQDTWGYYAAPNRRWQPEDFLAEAKALAKFCSETGAVGILNYYGDPSHVWNELTFFDAVKCWREVAEPSDLARLCP